MSKKRFLSIILSGVMLLSLACSALAVEQSGRYIGNSTVNGSIYQTYYQVDAQTRTGIKSISVSGSLYSYKGTSNINYRHFKLFVLSHTSLSESGDDCAPALYRYVG